MLSGILGLIPGGGLTAILAGAGALLVAMWRIFAAGKKSERNAQRAKEADAYEQHLKDIADAHDARNRVRADRVPDDDPYRRD